MLESFIARNRGGAGARTFDAFKAANDRRLAVLGSRGGGSIGERLSRLEAKSNRPRGMGATTYGPGHRRSGVAGYLSRPDVMLYRKAALHWLRTGETFYQGSSLGALERKVMHTELNPQGGLSRAAGA